jgi:hypothetical protein
LQFALGEGVRAFREALADPSTVSSIEPEEGGKKKRWSQPEPAAPH